MNLEPEIIDLVIQRSNGRLSRSQQQQLQRRIELTPDPDQTRQEIETIELAIAAVEVSHVLQQDSPANLNDRLLRTIKSQSTDAVDRNRFDHSMSLSTGQQNPLPNGATNSWRQSGDPNAVSGLRWMRSKRTSRRSRKREVFIWTIAAASLLALAIFIRQSPHADLSATSNPIGNGQLEMELNRPALPGGQNPPNPLVENMMPGDQQMQTFLASTPEDLLTLSWTPVDNKNVTGNVFWSDQQQTGFMTFNGLEINDPQMQQYQVWIYDTDSNQKRPVNGGVFDVSKSGHHVVPIAPISPIKKAVQFAITSEQPGGVEISQRKHVPTVASVPF
jgi:hypothetical protein